MINLKNPVKYLFIYGILIVLHLWLYGFLKTTSFVEHFPEPFPLSHESFMELNLTPTKPITQTFKLTSTHLNQLVLPYSFEGGRPTSGTVTIVLNTINSSSIKFDIPLTSLSSVGNLTLNLPPTYMPSSTENLTFHLTVDQKSSLSFFARQNPWLMPHRLNGKLVHGIDQMPEQLVFKPIYSNQTIPTLSTTKETMFGLLNNPLSALKIFLYCLVLTIMIKQLNDNKIRINS